ncbi:MAG: type IX secretion system membrane protein PorP/SprF [Vicingaceae bacterium]|nr:type IX secretion system membrane protein PorP/SprF [Vicingaceae bacterium]
MKNTYLLIITLVLLVSNAYAQQLPHFSQYYLNDFLINPAVAGANNYFEGKSSHRYQWEGITDAPRTYTLSVNGPTKNEKMGLGGYLFTDIVGPTRRTGFNLAYSYHVKLNDKLKLAFGLSAGLLQFTIDGSKITLRDEGDAIITNGVQSVLIPDAGFGTYLYHKKFYFGFSAPQLLNSKVEFFDDGKNPNGKLPAHFFVTGGYKYDLSDDFMLEPSFFVKYISPAPVMYDASLRIMYQQKVWLAGTYRHDDAIALSVGYLINNSFSIAYAYDFTTSNIKNHISGSHELMIGARFYNAKKNKKSTPSIE